MQIKTKYYTSSPLGPPACAFTFMHMRKGLAIITQISRASPYDNDLVKLYAIFLLSYVRIPLYNVCILRRTV